MRRKKMTEKECLAAIAAGDTAYELLLETDPNIDAKWTKLCKQIVKFLKKVRTRFPDAEYYTNSGGFNLLLGKPWSEESCGQNGKRQDQLLALSGEEGVKIGDGAWM